MSEYVHPSEIPEDIRQQLEERRRQKIGQRKGPQYEYIDPSEIPDEVLIALQQQRRKLLIQQLKK